MAAQTFVITNREPNDEGSFGNDPQRGGALSFLLGAERYARHPRDLRTVERDEFVADLREELTRRHGPERQAVPLPVYIHGFNNNFHEALAEGHEIGTGLERHGHLGPVLLFSWPSEGKTLEYWEDRDDARESVSGFKHFLSILRALRAPEEPPAVEASLLAHSMGNYVLREGAHYYRKQIGYPLNDIHFTQTLMLAPDLAYDSFAPDKTGRAIANLSHRVTIYHSRFDNVLGLSSGVKHFGARRLGRSGPRDLTHLPQNVLSVDCAYVNNSDYVHGAYRSLDVLLQDYIATMEGADRAAIVHREEIAGSGRAGFRLRPPGSVAARGGVVRPPDDGDFADV